LKNVSIGGTNPCLSFTEQTFSLLSQFLEIFIGGIKIVLWPYTTVGGIKNCLANAL
jgi:hypothetical protein